jgi:LacI family transcriptional regulator
VPSPAGLFVHREDIAVATLRLLRRAGRSSPEDVALISGRDDELLCTAWTPTISAVRIPAERIGYEAAVRLAQRLDRAGPPDRALRLRPAGLSIRQSTDVLAYDDPTVVQAIRFLRMHSHEGIRISDVVRALEVDRRRLERGFRGHLGQTPAAYLRGLRLNRAEDLIRNSLLPLEEIALRCGFASATRMSEAMRRERGYRPGTLRARSRRGQ